MEKEQDIMPGAIPENWYFKSEQDALCFYSGDALTSTLLESRPYTLMFHYFADRVSQHKNLTGAIGMYPDIAALRSLTGLSREDLAEIMDVPPDIVELYEIGWEPFPAGTASSLCKTLDWPFAAFFRGCGVWHPRTLLASRVSNGGTNALH